MIFFHKISSSTLTYNLSPELRNTLYNIPSTNSKRTNKSLKTKTTLVKLYLFLWTANTRKHNRRSTHWAKLNSSRHFHNYYKYADTSTENDIFKLDRKKKNDIKQKIFRYGQRCEIINTHGTRSHRFLTISKAPINATMIFWAE